MAHPPSLLLMLHAASPSTLRLLTLPHTVPAVPLAGLCTGVGYVNYGDGTAAAKAAEVMNGVRVQDRLLHVMVQRHPPGRKEPPHGSSYHQHQHQHSYHHSGMGATAHSRHESPEAYGVPHYQSQQAQQWTWQQAASVLACFVPPPQQGVQVQQGMQMQQGWPAGPNRM